MLQYSIRSSETNVGIQYFLSEPKRNYAAVNGKRYVRPSALARGCNAAVCVHRRNPIAILRFLAAYRALVDVHDRLRDLTGLPVADRTAVDRFDRHDSGRASRQKDFGCGVKLAAVDRTLDQIDAEIARDCHRAAARDAFENILRRIGCNQIAVLYDEDILGRAFRDMTVVRKHDRFIKAIGDRFAFRKRRVDVDARDFGARRRNGVFDAAPRAQARSQAFRFAEVTDERNCNDRKLVFDTFEPHADCFVGFVDEWTHVNFALEFVACAKLQRDLDELVRRLRELHHQNLRGVVQAAIVVARVQNVELALVRFPESADAFEASGTILKSVRQKADFGVGVPLKLSVRVHDEIVELHETPVRASRLAAPGEASIPAAKVVGVIAISWADIVVRLLAATVLGAIIGIERERAEHAAGLRTHALVSLGAALFMIISAYGFAPVLGEHVILDPSRIGAQVAS